MKTTLLTAALLIAGCTVFAQENGKLIQIKREVIYDSIKKTALFKLHEYCKEEDCDGNFKAADSINFQKQINVIFSTVVLNNADVVNNGSAFGYSVDDDKHKFSANMAFSGEKINWLMFDVGTSITNINDDFSYYSDGAWANDISLKFGVNIRWSSWQYVTMENCKKAKPGRELYIFEKLNEMQEALKNNKTSKELIKLKDDLITEGLSLKDSNKARDYKKELEKLYKQIEVLQQIEFINNDSVTSIEDSECVSREKGRNKAADTSNLKNKKIKSYVNKLISEYDAKNNVFHGYGIVWFNVNASVSNNTFKISNDSIMVASIQEKYPSIMRMSFEGSFNFSHQGRKTIQFFKAYTKLNRGSFLDAPNLKDQDIIVRTNDSDPENIYYELIDENGEAIQNYGNVRDPKYNMDLGGYYTGFFMFKKTLGATARANFNFPVGKGLEMNYKPNYTLLAGLAFRVASAEKWSSATFTINTGFENVLYDVNAFDSFIVKASIGVPFSIFQKKS